MTERVDVVVIGAGVMGTSLAYHLLAGGLCERVVLFEADPVHERSSTGLSAGGIRTLFSTRVNIALARESVAFYRSFPQHMAIGDEPGPDPGFRQNGYLFLLNEENERTLLARADFQEREGVRLLRLDRAGLAQRFPELRVDDLTGGVFGLDDGFLDPYQVLRGFTRKAQALGAEIVPEAVLRIEREGARVVAVESASRRVAADLAVVDAAGAWAGEVARLAGVDVPVTPVVRQLFQCQPPVDRFGDYPLTVDPSGLYFRPETGGRLLVGKSFADDEVGFSWDWQRQRFLERLWPELAERVPELERLRLESGWSGLYEMTPDRNGIIGRHPELANFYILAGFSGHGMMQAPAAGRALAEIIGHGECRSVDVAELGMDRFLAGREATEDAVI